jgi:hypothetical protein
MASQSKGAMASIFHSRFFRGFIVFLFAGVAFLVGGLAVSLLVEAVTGHGSAGGNIFSIVLGLILLILSPVVLILGIIIATGHGLVDKNT